MGPLGGGSHVSTAGGLLAVILRFDGECAAPLVDGYCNFLQFIYLPAIVMVSECIVEIGDRQLIILL